MPEAWQLAAIITAGFALATWYAWLRMRDAADAWISAWHYWQSRRSETRAIYDRWRRAVTVLTIATVIASLVAAWTYANRRTVSPTAEAVAVQARPEASRLAWH
jgi:hypothetical protein